MLRCYEYEESKSTNLKLQQRENKNVVKTFYSDFVIFPFAFSNNLRHRSSNSWTCKCGKSSEDICPPTLRRDLV